MKRGKLSRRTPLKRGTKPLTRSGRIKTKGKSRFPKRRVPAYVDWIRSLPCNCAGKLVEEPGDPFRMVILCKRRVEAAHIRSRGAGGDDRGNLIPLCGNHHGEQHAKGIRSFATKYRLDLAAEAQRLDALYAETHP